jgi:hypothetical protein
MMLDIFISIEDSLLIGDSELGWTYSSHTGAAISLASSARVLLGVPLNDEVLSIFHQEF